MLFSVIALIIGFGVGWISAFHTKEVVALLVMFGGGGLVIGKILFKSFFGLMDYFIMLPDPIRLALFVLFAALFVGRICGWIYKVYYYKEKFEAHAAKRARIYKEYGMDDPLNDMYRSKKRRPKVTNYQSVVPWVQK